MDISRLCALVYFICYSVLNCLINLANQGICSHDEPLGIHSQDQTGAGLFRDDPLEKQELVNLRGRWFFVTNHWGDFTMAEALNQTPDQRIIDMFVVQLSLNQV